MGDKELRPHAADNVLKIFMLFPCQPVPSVQTILQRLIKLAAPQHAARSDVVPCGGHRTRFPLSCPCKSGPVAHVAAAVGSPAGHGDVLAEIRHGWSAAAEDEQRCAMSPRAADAWQGEHR